MPCRRSRGKRVAGGIRKRSCYLPRSFVCGGGGVTARGAGRFFAADFCFASDFAFDACFLCRACFVLLFVSFCFCFVLLFVAWMLWCRSCSHVCHVCVYGADLCRGLGGVAGVAQGLEVGRAVLISSLDVVDVCGECCAVGVVPPWAGVGGALGPVCPVSRAPPWCCEACAFSVCCLQYFFSELVPVFWESCASVAGGPCHVSHGSGWGGGGVVCGSFLGGGCLGWCWCLVVVPGVGLWSSPVCWVMWITLWLSLWIGCG